MSGSQQTPKGGAAATNAGKKPDHRTGKNGYPVGLPDPLPGHSSLGAPPLVNDAQLMRDLCLDWTEGQVAEFQASIPVYRLEALDVANVYPPKEVWAFEKPAMVHEVEGYLKMKEVAGHKKPKPVHVLDMSRFKIIGPNENAVFYDDKGIVGVVIRDFLPILELVDHFDSLAAKHISMSRDIRKLDCGKIVQFGYTCGNDRSPTFGWCHNLLSVKHSEEEKRLHNHALMSAHTLIWNICQKKVPAEIMEAYGKVLAGGPVMDWNMEGRPIDAPISLHVGGQDHEIFGLALGPPQGICSTMYARYCHKENDYEAAPYVTSLTTSRTDDPTLGGSFYFAMHGIMVVPTANTLCIHNARQHHGTTGHDIDWQNWKASTGEGSVTHRGFSFCIPGKLPPLYAKFQKARAGEPATDVAGRNTVERGAEETDDEAEDEMEV
ncbi:hypothetical protein MMC27_005320 [Xylographa pallens]|nr:hypothetical protein [Xylographa pallens]